jgi:hypothetical protein
MCGVLNASGKLHKLLIAQWSLCVPPKWNVQRSLPKWNIRSEWKQQQKQPLSSLQLSLRHLLWSSYKQL